MSSESAVPSPFVLVVIGIIINNYFSNRVRLTISLATGKITPESGRKL